MVELGICKSSINWHIKNWAEGYEDMKEPFETYMKEFINPPAWVAKALKKAIHKNYWDKKKGNY